MVCISNTVQTIRRTVYLLEELEKLDNRIILAIWQTKTRNPFILITCLNCVSNSINATLSDDLFSSLNDIVINSSKYQKYDIK